MDRVLEPELMDDPAEAVAYAAANFRDVNARFVSRVVELATDRPTATICDLGCGPGDITLAIATALPHVSVRGIDASEAMLAIARSRGGAINNAHFQLADIKMLASGPFDLIISNSLLHHLPDPAAFWTAIARNGRPGTRVIVRDLLRPASPEGAMEIVRASASGESQLLQDEFYRSLLAAFTLDEIRDQLRQPAFEQLSVTQASDRHFDVVGVLS